MTRKLRTSFRTTPHLFSEWDRVARRIREKERLALFLDFDGTLVRIAPMPSGVRLDEATRDVLKKLSGNRKVTLAIISGRQRAELRRYVGIRNMKYLGLYGWENKENQRVPFPVREALARTLVSLLADLRSFPGVWIEPKRNSFSVHLLGASAKTQREIRQWVQKSVQPMRETLQVMANLRDLEVAPVALGNKGIAVRKLLDDPALREALPIYFGDDFSDEPGFAAARNGISVLVGKRRATKAKFCLRGPAEVAAALSRMEEAIR